MPHEDRHELARRFRHIAQGTIDFFDQFGRLVDSCESADHPDLPPERREPTDAPLPASAATPAAIRELLAQHGNLWKSYRHELASLSQALAAEPEAQPSLKPRLVYVASGENALIPFVASFSLTMGVLLGMWIRS